MNSITVKRSTVRTIVIILVVALVMLAAVAIVSAQTVPTAPITSTPFVGDARMCGNLPGAYAQTAVIYRTGSISGGNFLLYEINDRGVSTFLTEVVRADINEAVEEAAEEDEAQVLYSAATYTVSALPSGLCQYRSTQIPTVEGKPFVCTFTCN